MQRDRTRVTCLVSARARYKCPVTCLADRRATVSRRCVVQLRLEERQATLDEDLTQRAGSLKRSREERHCMLFGSHAGPGVCPCSPFALARVAAQSEVHGGGQGHA